MRHPIAYIRHVACRIREGRLRELLYQLGWMGRYVLRFWPLIGLLTLISMVSSGLGVALAVMTQLLVDSVTGHDSGMLGLAAAGYVSIGVGQILIYALRSRTRLKLNLRIPQAVRLDIFDRIIQADWEALSAYRPGDLQYRLGGDVTVVVNSLLTFLPSLMSMLVSFGGALVVMVNNDPVLALIALAGAPVSVFASRYNIARSREYQKKNQEFASQNVSFNQELFQNLQTIKAFGVVDVFTDRYRAQQRKSVQLQLEVGKYQQIGTVITSLVGQVVGYACYGFVIYRLWQGQITYGTMTMLVALAGSLRGSFTSLVNLAPSLLNACVSAGRVMEIVGLPREKAEETPKIKRMLACARETGVTVQMENVTAAYPGGKPVYTKAQLRAEPGEIIGLVGPSGLGKTTTLKLLLGLIHPLEGQVSVVCSEEESEVVCAATRKLFSYIPQGNTLFSGTIADNVRLMRPEASDEEVERALKAACAWDFVSELDDGPDTVLEDNARCLSEGQRQRLSIARAVLADAPVLLLDEATSALDVATERRVLRQIVSHDPTRTVIVTAHRPTVFEQCTRVYLVGEGTLAPLSHEQLRAYLDSEDGVVDGVTESQAAHAVEDGAAAYAAEEQVLNHVDDANGRLTP